MSGHVRLFSYQTFSCSSSFATAAYMNLILQEKLKNKQQLELQGEMAPYKIEADLILPDSPEEVYKLNDSNSLNQNVQMECGIQENPDSETKLHQLLKSNSRADAIVAG